MRREYGTPLNRTTVQTAGPTYEQALTTEALQLTRLEFVDLDPENEAPRTLILEPSHVLGYYLMLLDKELIRGIWEITDHRIEQDVVYLRLTNRDGKQLPRHSPWNAQVEIMAAEGTRMMINIRKAVYSQQTGEWGTDWRNEW